MYTTEDLDNIPTKMQSEVKQALSDIDFSSEDILKLLSTLKADKSPGPDKIHPLVLKEMCRSTVLPITSLV